MPKQANGNGADLGMEAQFWTVADNLRGNMEPSDYKPVALGRPNLPQIKLGCLRGEAGGTPQRRAG